MKFKVDDLIRDDNDISRIWKIIGVYPMDKSYNTILYMLSGHMIAWGEDYPQNVLASFLEEDFNVLSNEEIMQYIMEQ
jgi:hypothetical protein